MDQDTVLDGIRRLAAVVLRQADSGLAIDESDAVELAEFVQSLDEWISKGGSFPAAWER